MNYVNHAISRLGEFRIHPLGFFYLKIADEGGLDRRVHVWLPDEVPVYANETHQHSFDIDSRILTGAMRSDVFSFLEDMTGDIFEFNVVYRNGNSSLVKTDRVGNLELICSFDSHSGDRYFLKAGCIHKIAITKRPCVTILEVINRNIPIYSYGKDVNEPLFERRFVNNWEREMIFATLRSLI